MKNNRNSLKPESVNTKIINEKKNWIEPQISAWGLDQLELGNGGKSDAGTKTYL